MAQIQQCCSGFIVIYDADTQKCQLFVEVRDFDYCDKIAYFLYDILLGLPYDTYVILNHKNGNTALQITTKIFFPIMLKLIFFVETTKYIFLFTFMMYASIELNYTSKYMKNLVQTVLSLISVYAFYTNNISIITYFFFILNYIIDVQQKNKINLCFNKKNIDNSS